MTDMTETFWTSSEGIFQLPQKMRLPYQMDKKVFGA
jgi:hypothetical protein